MTKRLSLRTNTPSGDETHGNFATVFEQPIFDECLLLPQSVCAIALGISVNALRKWRVRPRKRQGRQVLYYLPDLLNYREQRDEKQELNLNFERARLAAAQADRAELAVKQLRGELIPADEILRCWGAIVSVARAKLLGIPSKVKTAIPKLTDNDLAKIKMITRGALEDLANGGKLKGVGSNRSRVV